MELKWVVQSKRADFAKIASEFNIDQVLAKIIVNRGIIENEDISVFLHSDMSAMHNPLLLKDMSKAVDIIKEKISSNKKIRIIGDYDVDGICSTFILLKGLKELGATVDTVIPHRILDGYGLNNQLIEQAHLDGIDTILTCDNGIAAKEQIDLANSYGMTVIVTDHHEVPYVEENSVKRYIVPNAAAVVDPKQEDCKYPFKSICGAMIAFKFIEVILDNKYTDIITELIPFAAMATVCDVMELLDENRVIVKEGLRLMSDPVNIGLRALKIATSLSDKTISAYHFGFVLGPTINATGRLDTAQRALELFSSENFNEACIIATQLRQLNDERKKITEEGTAKAIDIIENDGLCNEDILVVYLDNCHESIAGIIAGRIKEKYYKPVIVLTDSEDGIKGSGRSIESYDMYANLTKVSDIFTKYGGHKMAAGVSLRSLEDVTLLRKRLNENSKLSKDDLTKKLRLDAAMPLSYISYGLIKSFDMLEPCGTANPKPVFGTKPISLLSYKKMGKTKIIGKFEIKDQTNKTYEMVYYDDLNDFDNFIINKFGKEKFDLLLNGGLKEGDINIKIAYSPSINVFNNREKIQIVMKHYDVYIGE